METMCGKMDASTRDIIDSIRNTVKERIPTPMEASTKVNGKKVCSMEWAAL